MSAVSYCGTSTIGWYCSNPSTNFFPTFATADGQDWSRFLPVWLVHTKTVDSWHHQDQILIGLSSSSVFRLRYRLSLIPVQFDPKFGHWNIDPSLPCYLISNLVKRLHLYCITVSRSVLYRENHRSRKDALDSIVTVKKMI